MTAWYCERRTFTGWSPELHPDGAPFGCAATHGSVKVKTHNGAVKLRRILPVPDWLQGASLSMLQSHFAAVETDDGGAARAPSGGENG